MNSKMRLAACIKIRSKEASFMSRLDTNVDPTMAKTASSILSKINPTSFRNTGLTTIKGMGIHGAIAGAGQLLLPGVHEATSQAFSGGARLAGESLSHFRQNIFANMAGNLGGLGYKLTSAAPRELARQKAVFDAMRNGLVTPAELADNVTRYIPAIKHQEFYNNIRKNLGKDVALKYKDAFIMR